MNMTITGFLLARIAEDEARARDAFYDGQQWIPEEEAVVAADRDLEPILYLDRKRDATHAAKWTPARVLAECAAKRAIIEQHKDWPVLVESKPSFSETTGDLQGMAYRVSQEMAWLTEREYERRFGVEAPTTNMILALAAVYADHPDYNPEWAL